MQNISSFSSPLLLLLLQRNNNDNNNNKSNRLNLLVWFNRVIPSNLDYNKTIMADMFHPKKIPSFVSVYRRKLKLTLSQGNKGMKVVYVYTYTRGGDESDKGSSKRKNGGGKVLAFSRKSEFVTSGSRCHFETDVGQTDWHFSNEHWARTCGSTLSECWRSWFPFRQQQRDRNISNFRSPLLSYSRFQQGSVHFFPFLLQDNHERSIFLIVLFNRRCDQSGVISQINVPRQLTCC